MAGKGQEVLFKSLATWKTWWQEGSAHLAVAEGLVKYVNTRDLPGSGELVSLFEKGKVTEHDLEQEHTCRVVEALLKTYPADKQPSAYCLGDAVQKVDHVWCHVILGKPSDNPCVEKARRDQALREGHKLKLLLSYIRNSSSRHDKGRKATVTFLKELANSQPRPRKGSKSGGSELASPTSSTSLGTTLVLGQECESASFECLGIL